MIGCMDKHEASENMLTLCRELSAQITRLHPLVPKLGDDAAQGEIYKALFELTKQVEVVKKQTMKAKNRDDSPEL